MTAEEILVEVVKLAPSEIALLESAIHAMLQALATGQTREEAVTAARQASDAALDALEAAMVPKA
jgi:hypothetical protein